MKLYCIVLYMATATAATTADDFAVTSNEAVKKIFKLQEERKAEYDKLKRYHNNIYNTCRQIQHKNK